MTDQITRPKSRWGDAVARYGIALLSVVIGVGIRLPLASTLGSAVPYITLFPAVMFAAWFGGLGPGLLASLLSLAAAEFFVIPPLYRLIPATSADLAGALIFLSVSIFVSVLNEALRRARARSDRRLTELIAETTSRTHAEKALAESKREVEHARDLLQITLASIGDAVISTDAEGRVTFLNSVAEQLTGWNFTEAAGEPISKVFAIRHETSGLDVQCPVRQVIRDGLAASIANHTVLISKDGRSIPIEDTAAPVRDDAQRLVGVVLVFRDVTVRRQSETTLRKSEERLRLALSAGHIGVWDWDIGQDRLELSSETYTIFGVGPGLFGGRSNDYLQLIHPEDRERAAAVTRAAIHSGAAFDGVEFRVVRPDGEIRWVSTTAEVLRNEAGEPVRMIGATTDITDRAQAEAHLRQQWRTFDSALSNTPDFIYTFDLAGRFTYANRSLLALWKKSLDEALGKNFDELNYPADLADRLNKQIQQVIARKAPLRDHTPFTGADGSTGHYEYIFVPVLTADGQVEAVAGSTRDITERNRAEEELRKSEERLTLALEAGGGVGTWDWVLPADRVYANARFAELFAVPPERAAAGAPLGDFLTAVHPDDRSRISHKIERAIATGEDFAEEYRLVQQDSPPRWVYARGRVHLDGNGSPERFPGVVIDITERKRAEESLSESQARLRAIFDGTFEYIGLLAPDGTLLEANRSSLEFAGNTREDVVGRPFWEIPWFQFTPGAPAQVREGVRRAAAGESVRYETLIRRPSGEVNTFEISLHPIRGENGEVVLIVPEGSDVSEQKQAEEGLRRSNEELTRVNRELEEFAYVSSHDLQEPLRMVNIYTQLLLKHYLTNEVLARDDQVQQYADFVRQGVHRMEALIKDLLFYSRIVHPEQEEAHPANLEEVLDEALSMLDVRLKETGAVIVRNPLPTVWGEQRQLALVFQNLLSNALKYRRMDRVPRIEIDAVQQGDRWAIRFTDNGIGFDPRHSERIFGLFKRLHKDAYPGTGLGLAICKRIVERYDGTIRASSEGDGRGAVFTLVLRAASL